MKNITLRNLTLEDKDQFLEVLSADWGKFSFDHYWLTIADKDFNKYIQVVPEFSKGLHISSVHVPCTILFAFNQANQLVGRTSIRHELTESLLRDGGHIGYGVAPIHRRLGHASEILKESLVYIENNLPLLKKVLVTCDEGNIGSQKTIEKNGGNLENIVDMPNNPRKMRYWIDLKS